MTNLRGGGVWAEFRSALIEGEGLPRSWPEAARWYRHASRERTSRDSAGALVAAILEHLRALNSPDALRRCYIERDGKWAHGLADQGGLGDACRGDPRRIEDAAYGLRWLELVLSSGFDMTRSPVPQLRLTVLAPDRRSRPQR